MSNDEFLDALSELTPDELDAEICRRSFHFFVKYFWDTIIAEDFIDNWHIKYLCDELQAVGQRVALLSRGTDEQGKPLPPTRLKKEYDYIIINVPPGSSKSTICSEMYPLWCWTIDPTQRFICGSYASTPAEDIADKCFKIYNSEKFVRLFPELHSKKKTGGKTHFQNGLLGERYTTSTGSGITGIHAHQKLIDDPMNPQIAASDTERASANTWVSETLGSRNVDNDVTVAIVIMQRLHEMDTTGYLLAKKSEGLRVKHICIPAELSPRVSPEFLKEYYKDGLFDPVRRSRKSLEEQRVILGARGYAGQFEQAPTTPGGNIILNKWFKYVSHDRMKLIMNPLRVPVIFFVDTAYTDNSENDPTGIIATCLIDNNLYILNAAKVYMTFPQLIQFLPGWVMRNGYTDMSSIRLEPKANGLPVIQTLQKETGLNITNTPSPRESKETRLNAVSPKVECGRVILLAGAWNDEFVEEVCGFPNKPHDEYVDLLCYAIDYHISGGRGQQPLESFAAFFR